MSSPKRLARTSFINIKGIDDGLFDNILLNVAVTIAKRQFKTKFFFI